MLKRLFTEHPHAVDETYREHFAAALGFANRLLMASLACYLHALLPFLFQRTGSRAINDLHARMVTNRHRRPQANWKRSDGTAAVR